jgi:hypothetical protein
MKKGMTISGAIMIALIILTSCGGKSSQEFAKEMCNEMDKGTGLMQIVGKVGEERKKHDDKWFADYKAEVARLGCAHQ